MSILATLAMSALPKLLLGAVSDWQRNKQLAEGSKENTKREVSLALINAELDRRRVRSAERKAAFEFPLFWYPWMIMAIPFAVWFGLGMMDSAGLELWEVHELPPQLKGYADAIAISLFGSGGVVQLGQGVLRVMAARK